MECQAKKQGQDVGNQHDVAWAMTEHRDIKGLKLILKHVRRLLN